MTDWWMYHGNCEHTGLVEGSRIDVENVKELCLLHDVPLEGPVLSVPAVVGDFVYVGLANSWAAAGATGGQLLKISLTSGEPACKPFTWPIDPRDGDTHGFMGMGCTPAVATNPGDNKEYVFFSTFNGKLYCLHAEDLTQAWVTDLRNADPDHNQPVSNTADNGQPPAAGWSSPVVATDLGSVYVGIGEGENDALFGFVYCLNMSSGNVNWIYCTCLFKGDITGQPKVPNKPNHLPPAVVKGPLPSLFTRAPSDPPVRGCSVWSSIAYDKILGRVYCATGNPNPDGPLPTAGFSNGILALDALSGECRGFFQPHPKTSYRRTDQDVDFGGSPVVFERDGRRLVAAGCKNGGFFVLDAASMKLVRWRQLLPYYNDRRQIPTVDPHIGPSDQRYEPSVPNSYSNAEDEENYSGTYSTPAVHADMGRIFIGIGGNNYHNVKAGIDYSTTPFMRAMDWETLDDVWAMDNSDPRRYILPQPPMYRTPGEAALSSPAVVNDVVFCSTSKIALYAFHAWSGEPLWEDQLGEQTGGMSGGYGYCLGPAIAGDYVVVGALVFGKLGGGVLRIYKLP
jgi:outer membrane protein assembly factor BamB